MPRSSTKEKKSNGRTANFFHLAEPPLDTPPSELRKGQSRGQIPGHGVSSSYRKHGKPEETPEPKTQSKAYFGRKESYKKLFRSSEPAAKPTTELLELPQVALTQILSYLTLEERKNLRMTCRDLFSADSNAWIQTRTLEVARDTIFLHSLPEYRAMSLGLLKHGLSEIFSYQSLQSLQRINFNPKMQNTDGENRMPWNRVMMIDLWDLISAFPLGSVTTPTCFSNVTELRLQNCVIGLAELEFLSSFFPHTERISLSEKLFIRNDEADTEPEIKAHYRALIERLEDRICYFRKVKRNLYEVPSRIQHIKVCMDRFHSLEFLKLCA